MSQINLLLNKIEHKIDIIQKLLNIQSIDISQQNIDEYKKIINGINQIYYLINKEINKGKKENNWLWYVYPQNIKKVTDPNIKFSKNIALLLCKYQKWIDLHIKIYNKLKTNIKINDLFQPNDIEYIIYFYIFWKNIKEFTNIPQLEGYLEKLKQKINELNIPQQNIDEYNKLISAFNSHYKTIFKEINDGEKKSCWAWYVFPTNMIGQSDPLHTHITEKSAPLLCNNKKWIDIHIKIYEKLKTNIKNNILFKEIDIGRIKFFTNFWMKIHEFTIIPELKDYLEKLKQKIGEIEK